MKIEMWQVKPGMLINRNTKKKPIYELVIAREFTDDGQKIGYSHFDAEDAYYGALTGFVDRKNKVYVVKKKSKRAKIIKSILDDVFKQYHATKKDIDLLRLIQAMEK